MSNQQLQEKLPTMRTSQMVQYVISIKTCFTWYYSVISMTITVHIHNIFGALPWGIYFFLWFGQNSSELNHEPKHENLLFYLHLKNTQLEGRGSQSPKRTRQPASVVQNMQIIYPIFCQWHKYDVKTVQEIDNTEMNCMRVLIYSVHTNFLVWPKVSAYNLQLNLYKSSKS
jgi:hypothetical protein